MTRWTTAVLALALVFVAGSGLAQPLSGPRRVGAATPLLRSPDVQKELALTDDQRDKVLVLVQKMADKYRPEFDKLKNAPAEERQAKSVQLHVKRLDETGKVLVQILRPEQLKRLGQLLVQAQGVDAFIDPEVQEALRLTDEQRAKVKELVAEYQKESGDVFRSRSTNEEAEQQMSALKKRWMEKAVALLTDGQKKTWKELSGKPFKGQLFGSRPSGVGRGREAER
jgi:hypothetical protein